MKEPFRYSRAVLGYLVGAVCVLVTFCLRWLLAPVLDAQAPLMMFVLAALIAALYGGLGPGIAAMLAGGLLGDYFFVFPYHTLGPRSLVEWAYSLTYLAETGMAIGIIEALRRTRRHAENATRLAQARGEELQNGMREISQAEAKIRELAAVVESARDAIVSTTLQYQVKSWNRAAERLFGYTAAEMIGQSLLRLVRPEEHEALGELFTRVQRGELVEANEAIRLTKDGREIGVSVSLSPVSNCQGEIVGVSSIMRDLGPAKRAEQALQARLNELRLAQETLRKQNEDLGSSRQALEIERSRYRELFNSAPVGYLITSTQGVIQQANLAAASLLNESTEFLVGFPLARLLAKEDRPRFFANIGRLTRREIEKIENWEVLVQPQGRPAFPAALTVNLVRDEARRLNSLRWLLRDISERKQAEIKILRLNTELEERVRQRTAELEASNRELEAFTASVSHDLRAPLRSISGFTKAVLEDYGDRLDPQGVTYLRYAYDSCLRMGRLIEDLIALSRYARCEFSRQEVNLSSLAQLVVADLQQNEPHRKVDLVIAPDLKVRGDQGLLRIALENLLSNAWKFTAHQPQAKIELGASRSEGSLWYYVRDNGAGFNMAQAGRLFGAFQRLHSAEEFPGTGIGLATVKRIFHRHGGDVWAESKVNEGATFYFTLPNGS